MARARVPCRCRFRRQSALRRAPSSARDALPQRRHCRAIPISSLETASATDAFAMTAASIGAAAAALMVSTAAAREVLATSTRSSSAHTTHRCLAAIRDRRRGCNPIGEAMGRDGDAGGDRPLGDVTFHPRAFRGECVHAAAANGGTRDRRRVQVVAQTRTHVLEQLALVRPRSGTRARWPLLRRRTDVADDVIPHRAVGRPSSTC